VGQSAGAKPGNRGRVRREYVGDPSGRPAAFLDRATGRSKSIDRDRDRAETARSRRRLHRMELTACSRTCTIC